VLSAPAAGLEDNHRPRIRQATRKTWHTTHYATFARRALLTSSIIARPDAAYVRDSPIGEDGSSTKWLSTLERQMKYLGPGL